MSAGRWQALSAQTPHRNENGEAGGEHCIRLGLRDSGYRELVSARRVGEVADRDEMGAASERREREPCVAPRAARYSGRKLVVARSEPRRIHRAREHVVIVCGVGLDAVPYPEHWIDPRRLAEHGHGDVQIRASFKGPE